VVPLRGADSNPVQYAGAEFAEQQRTAYPDIRPLLLDLSRDRAFQLALDAAQAKGWTLVDADPATGRIEATDRTFWFGFQDDIVIRITPVDANRSVIDVRSSSRVGGGDMGANARRVRDFLATLSQ
jgi:uncharacterized protein (DUF1499 family)